ncbi:uncharacterized protein YlbG (UPF0298 family) [Bacillus oleivorans]|uniref:UPF0298 protein SAMN05877753_10733 n=1 Tax=Bacillus oleivorans TaxID=1448271 RepID=A0A285D0K8_9BACI|nr:DUF2129 domain-containing protein [Bacillus oleivorans]SNX73344.1 uncharacterized protein YlbG (UPF0298 family) [Bacillus oleivorans]
MIVDRQGFIVWLSSLKQAKQLRRLGNVHYISKRLKYAVLYCSMEESEWVENQLHAYPFVRKVELSYKSMIKTHYENKKPDKAKEYDYKIGF